MSKITIVGAGRVGESSAQFIACQDIVNEIALIDIREGAAEGAALDIQESAPIFAFDTKVTGSTDSSLMAGSDIIVVTAGLPRKPGMTRSDVLGSNIPIIDSIIDSAKQHSPDSILLFVTNPVDVITWHAFQRSGWPASRVIGQAGVLDSSRMATFIAEATGYSVRDVNTMVLGGHGDSMLPMLRLATVAGIPVQDMLPKEKLEEIVERTRHGGAEVLSLRQNSSAYDAPAASVMKMVDAIINDRKRIIPTVSILQGEYGRDDIAIGVPAVLGSGGMEKIIEVEMTTEEKADFDDSAAIVTKDIGLLDNL